MPEHPSLPPRRRPPPFRPRFTIGVLYLVGFFFLFSFLQVLPELIGLLRDMQPGPEQQAEAERVAREGSSPLIALLLSVAATSLGSYLKVLPGMRVDS